MKVCSHYIPSLGQTRNNLTFEKGLTAEKNPNPRALLLSARNAAELLFTPTIRSFHLLRVLLVFPPLPLLSLSSSCFHLILTPSSSRLFSLKCFFFRDALFISVPLYLPTRLSRQPLGFLPKRVFFFFFFSQVNVSSVLSFFPPLPPSLSFFLSLCLAFLLLQRALQLKTLQCVYAGTHKPCWVLSGGSCCNVCVSESFKGPSL